MLCNSLYIDINKHRSHRFASALFLLKQMKFFRILRKISEILLTSGLCQRNPSAGIPEDSASIAESLKLHLNALRSNQTLPESTLRVVQFARQPSFAAAQFLCHSSRQTISLALFA